MIQKFGTNAILFALDGITYNSAIRVQDTLKAFDDFQSKPKNV